MTALNVAEQRVLLRTLVAAALATDEVQWNLLQASEDPRWQTFLRLFGAHLGPTEKMKKAPLLACLLVVMQHVPRSAMLDAATKEGLPPCFHRRHLASALDRKICTAAGV